MPIAPDEFFPTHLLLDLSGAELLVDRWSHDDDTLMLRVVKSRRLEHGRLSFRGVSHVCLPTASTLLAVEVLLPDEVPSAFWHAGTPRPAELGDSDRIVLLFAPGGKQHFVIAESADYARTGGQA